MLEKRNVETARVLLEAWQDMDWFERSLAAREPKGLTLAIGKRDEDGHLERDGSYVFLDPTTAQLLCAGPDEGGASLRGAGWKLIGERGGGSWSRDSRPRVDTAPTQGKLLWEKENA